MSNITKKAIMQAKINEVLTDLMVKTTGDMVFLDDTTTLAAKLAEMIASLNGKVTATALANALNGYVTKENGKGLSANDFTDDLLNKLNAIAAGAQVNVIEKIKVNGVEQKITDKAVDITVPDYTIEKAADSGAYAAIYQMKKCGVAVGAAINIPKDMVVESGSVVTNPAGQAAGTYIKLVLQNVDDPLYINVSALIEYVTSGSKTGDMVVITIDELTHKVTASITDGTITKAKLSKELQTMLENFNGANHSHANKGVLDNITQDKVNAWDGKSVVSVTDVGGTKTSGVELMFTLVE